MRRKSVLLVACLLSGCQSSLTGVKLGEDGALPSDPAHNGIPYALTRPKFKVLKDDKDKYSVSVDYVVDSTQRYSLRLDPAILADSKFKMTFGETGALSGLTASVTDQTVPTAVAIIKMAGSIATGIAAPIGMGDDNVDPVKSGCLAKATVADVITCAMQDTVGLAAPACTPAQVANFVAWMAPFKAPDDTDKGDALGSLYVLNPADETCFSAATKELAAQAKEAIGVAPAAPMQDPPPPPPPPNPPPAPPRIDGLRVLAAKAFDDVGPTLDGPLKSQWYASRLRLKARSELLTRIDLTKADDLKALMGAVQRYRAGKREKLYEVLQIPMCTELPDPLPAPAPPPQPVTCRIDRLIVDAVDGAVTAAGLNTEQPAVRLDRIARVKTISKGLADAGALDATDWRKRRIAHLDRIEDRATREALQSRPDVDPGQSLAVDTARRQKAATVGLTSEYERLKEIRYRLNYLPGGRLDGRQSPTAEYAGLRTEGEKLEALISSRLAAATPPAAAKTDKPEDLPPDTPWVSERCIKDSKGLEGWTFLEGKTAPDYVIVLRRADGSRSAINPSTAGCPA